MAIKKNSKKEAETQEVQALTIEVLRARDFTEEDQEGCTISVDLKINGVTIYGCWYREGKKKDGSDYAMLAFPSREDPKNKGKYYNHAYVKLSDKDVENIAAQIEQKL